MSRNILLHTSETTRRGGYDCYTETLVGFRPKSWALPLLLTFTPWLFEIAVGPFYFARERIGSIPF